MDIEREKRRKKIRLIMTETIMVVAVVAMVFLLLAIVSGWRINDDFSVEQYGQVDIRSYPTGARIIIDNEQQSFAATNTSRMLTEGEHKIRLERDEFDSWEKTVKIIPGWAVRLRYPRLFRVDRETEKVSDLSEVAFFSVAPDRESVLYGEKNQKIWKWVSIQNDDTQVREIDVSNILSGEVTEREWAWGSEKVLVHEKGGEWTVVNLSRPKESIKLGNYEKVVFMDGAGSKVWAMRDGKIYIIEVGVSDGTKKVLSGVKDFSADGGEIVYLIEDDGKKKVMLFHEGDEGGVDLGLETEMEKKVKMAASTYAGESFIGVTVDGRLMIYRTENYPTYESEDYGIEMVAEKELGFVPEGKIEGALRSGEFFVLHGGEEVAVFDAELGEIYQFDYKGVGWADDYMFAEIKDGKLEVVEFDGTNRRTLAEDVEKYPVVVTANNKWLYYIKNIDEKKTLVREKVN